MTPESAILKSKVTREPITDAQSLARLHMNVLRVFLHFTLLASSFMVCVLPSKTKLASTFILLVKVSTLVTRD